MNEPTIPVKSARRALDVLQLLTDSPGPLTFPEIGRALGIPASSLSGLLHTLVDAGWLEHEELSRSYSLGLRVLEAGNAYTRSRSLIGQAVPVISSIRDHVDETIQVAVLDGRHNVYVAKAEAQQLLTLTSAVGGRLPAHATAVGKVLLAGLPAQRLSDLLKGVNLERYTPHTLSDQRQLGSALVEIRRKGYGWENEEHAIGVRCLATPVLGPRGTVIAAMGVAIPTVRFDDEKRARALSLLLEGASTLSRSLGYTGGGSSTRDQLAP